LFLIAVAMFSLSQISKGENIDAIYNQDNSIHENSIQEFEKSILENIGLHPKSSNSSLG